ncbi:hypothetical protein UUU_06160 [Klebsiella pneumoniae subsp. pneumoniae DSM 30104 = JCM 1662 = NBRC 14940]|nr:hypothetical protein UUU_06160 [Klebsiella pneumoniae subsp. pneumoniae DSM 30104 = JCM 1662 = NBRC 14940]
MDPRLRHFVQAGEASRHGDRVAGEGARLIDRTGGSQGIHHLTAAAEGAYRHPAADDFPQTGQIRLHAVVSLSACQRHAEAGHHFVDNQQGAKFVAQGAQARQEFRLRRNAVHISGHRLDDDAGDLLRILLERRAHRGEVVISAGQGMFGEIGRDARRVRLAEGQRAGTGFHQQAVGMAVVAAFELNDFVASGEAARQANGAHGGFGTGVHHPHHIHGRHQLGHQGRHFHFHFGRRAKAQAAGCRLDHRIANSRVVVAQHHRTPGTDIIDIGFPIHVIEVSAIRAFDKQRCAADAGESAHRRVNAAGDQFARSVVQIFRFAHGQGPGS